jgi:hypothetical protein
LQTGETAVVFPRTGSLTVSHCTAQIKVKKSPWSKALLEKLIIVQIVKKLPVFLGGPKVARQHADRDIRLF